MTVQQQPRFSAEDQESVNKLLQDYFDSAIEDEGNDQPFVASGTQAERDRIWTAWADFCGLTQRKAGEINNLSIPEICRNVDPCRFWVDFAREPEAPRVQAPVQAFLHHYVQNSIKELSLRFGGGSSPSSFLQLIDTPWLPVLSWKKTDIVFIAQDPHLKPYLRREPLAGVNTTSAAAPTTLLPPPQQQQYSSIAQKTAHLNRSLDHLGILLLELCFGSPLEFHSYRKSYPSSYPAGGNGTGSVTTITEAENAAYDLAAAREWQYEVEEEAGREYFEAVAWCLGSLTRYDRWWEDMLREVVQPLGRSQMWTASSFIP
ncbi:hypothetical protein V8F06_014488 [Rhypophila decipiens]